MSVGDVANVTTFLPFGGAERGVDRSGNGPRVVGVRTLRDAIAAFTAESPA